MIVIRNMFVAKPGCAGKLAAQIKEALTAAEVPAFRVLTDMTGDFNRVIMEIQAEDLTAFEARMKADQSNPVLKEKLKGSTDLWETGSREILRIA